MHTTVPRALPALLLGGVLAALAAGCTASSGPAPSAVEPAVVEDIDGSEIKLVRLTPEAANRLGIVTASTLEEGNRLVVPYGAVFYDPDGGAWVYVEREPLQFVREAVTVDVIEGDLATLTDGPAPGANVVSTGVAELYGTEFKVGH
jgi:hypothetical protein